MSAAEEPVGAAVTDTPGWVDDVVLYGVIPGRFGPDGLRSVTARLPDLVDLGVDALWLSPIAAAPPGDYGYAVVDYTALDPRHGTEDDLRELVNEAHRRGLRVLLDLVPNHTSDRHPFFLDTLERGADSRYWSWYDRREDGTPTHYFDWTHLPNLNLDHADVRAHLLEASRHWIRAFDIDGYRVDVAWGVRQRAPDFWPLWRRELKAVKPDLLLVAEASARDPYYAAHGFDAAYDWTEELGHWAWDGVFDRPEGLVGRLHAALTNEGRGYPPGMRVLRFLANNDTGPRFTATHPPGLCRVAAALLLTLPGLPCLFTGDERALAYEPYDGGGPLTWEGDLELRAWFRRLIAERRASSALRSASWRPVPVEGGAEVYAYVRGRAPDAVLVVLNFGAEEAAVTVPLDDVAGALGGSSLRDRLDPSVQVGVEGATIAVRLAGHGVRLLAPVPPAGVS